MNQHDHGGVAVDYKRGYAIKDRKTRPAMTVFGRGSGAGSGSGASEDDDYKQQQNNNNNTASLSSGKSKHKKIRPQATLHIKKFNPIPNDAVDSNNIELFFFSLFIKCFESVCFFCFFLLLQISLHINTI